MAINIIHVIRTAHAATATHLRDWNMMHCSLQQHDRRVRADLDSFRRTQTLSIPAITRRVAAMGPHRRARVSSTPRGRRVQLWIRNKTESPTLFGLLTSARRGRQDLDSDGASAFGALRIAEPELRAGASQRFEQGALHRTSPTSYSGGLVPKGGLEPPRVAPHAPQTCASASSATSARCQASIALSRA